MGPTLLTLSADTLTAKIDLWAEELGWDRDELRAALAVRTITYVMTCVILMICINWWPIDSLI
jgi:hypothetical protein